MARYIKVEDAIEVADYGCGEFRGIFGLIKERLEATPTADVVPVVRCKDCKHYNEEDEFCIRWADMFAYCDWEDTKRVYPDGFCSFGERRDDEESTKRTD